jgi:hypothetical protein
MSELTDIHVDTPFEYLDLSVRLSNCIEGACNEMPAKADELGLPPPYTVGAIIQWSRRDLSWMKNIGLKTIRELEKILEDGGFTLRDEKTKYKPKTCMSCSITAIPGHLYCSAHNCSTPGCLSCHANGNHRCTAHKFSPGWDTTRPPPPPTPFDRGNAANPDELDLVTQIVRDIRRHPKDTQVRVIAAVSILLEVKIHTIVTKD